MLFGIFFVPLTMARKTIKKKTLKPRFSFPKRYLLFVLVILAIGGVVYFGFRLFFAASVNGRLISRFSVIKSLEKQGGKTTLDTIILKTLINQEAKKRKVDVTEKELDAELVKIESNVTSQGTTLEALLLQQGMTKKDLANEIKLQLLVTKMVSDKVSVTEKEIDEYLASQNEQSSSDLDQSTPEITRDQAKEAIKQQKTQEEIQNLVADLKAKAKINYFIKY
ncbi:MAG: Foldase protein PrsA [Candidatus Roizmanbacteria bacterium GW2011_GWC2_37_13]|uniref:Foldase protein PrsA n=1 Tax=Candidatus Roizmanbacteria bacterium GW2011_GWC2_37_13 TaxID=1618486 RepID=A0A0G0IJC5_9BACT|nr:MAG: Foldase protein PrsA [Candidatus Roizmanbacteria bacterium GW2011_GWC1_37_12]KKQ24314.1 MAG: Foldase protein PrsA [Candidatus Roizmanbacteria bacterium GW2011_GWC2_37_13]